MSVGTGRTADCQEAPDQGRQEDDARYHSEADTGHLVFDPIVQQAEDAHRQRRHARREHKHGGR